MPEWFEEDYPLCVRQDAKRNPQVLDLYDDIVKGLKRSGLDDTTAESLASNLYRSARKEILAKLRADQSGSG